MNIPEQKEQRGYIEALCLREAGFIPIDFHGERGLKCKTLICFPKRMDAIQRTQTNSTGTILDT
jgi:hypothetical protein